MSVDIEVMTASDAQRAHQDHVRVIAQSDPVPNLTASWGDIVTSARSCVESLTTILRSLDKVQDHLAERGLTVEVDLGPIGNAAAAARRDLEKERPGNTFTLPTA